MERLIFILLLFALFENPLGGDLTVITIVAVEAWTAAVLRLLHLLERDRIVGPHHRPGGRGKAVV